MSENASEKKDPGALPAALGENHARHHLLHPAVSGRHASWTTPGARSVTRYGAWRRTCKSLNLPPHSNIALLGKNSAHWIMADLAIWMAGHVTVPLYPTLNAETAQYILEHCEARLLFIGKLDGKIDGWNDIKTVIPAGLPKIGLPMSPESGHRRSGTS